jgi:hypothetical protein
MWVYAKHFKRKCFSSSTLLLSQIWKIISIHDILGIVQHPIFTMELMRVCSHFSNVDFILYSKLK